MVQQDYIMKRLTIYIFSLFSFCIACKTTKSIEQESTDSTETNEQISFNPKLKSAIVIDKTGLDGCSFLLQLPDSSFLEAVNLDDQFKVNGLEVFISYKPVEMMSVCMAGTTVELLTIELRK